MNNLRQAAQQALKALESPAVSFPVDRHEAAAVAEPVAQFSDIVSDGGMDPRNNYAAPPQREPLTDAQAERLYQNIKPSQQQDARSCAAFKRLVRVVEAAHGISAPASAPKEQA